MSEIHEAATPARAEPVQPAVDKVDASPRELAFHFHGRGSEYFRIWIVNILLSIVTLGIYSAWAKVRNKQYFYGNTELEGSAFAYLASPIQILKGRLMALGLIIGYSILSNFSPQMSLLALGLVLLVMPFLVQRSLVFNARYSAWRNVRFNFNGGYKEAFVIFGLLPLGFLLLVVASGVWSSLQQQAAWLIFPLLMIVVLGVPYFVYRQKHYFVGHSLYGTSEFAFAAELRSFAGVWGKLLLLTLGALLLVVLVIGLMVVLTGLAAVFTSEGEVQPEVLGALFLPLLLVIYVAFALFYLLPFVYFSVRINNLVYNHTSLPGFQLQANYKLWSYGRLVVGNTLLTLLTLGLFRPWALVRTARYKAAHTQLLASASLDDFAAGQPRKVGALGEEIGEFYDLDFGF